MQNHTPPIFGAVLFALLLAPALVSAKPGGGQGVLNPERIERIADRLGVSEDVASQMKSMVYEAKRTQIDLRATLEKNRVDLQEMIHSESPDEAAVMAKLDTIGLLQTKVKKLRIGTMLKVRALLTPEQRKLLRKMMAKPMGKRGRKGRRGHRGHRGMGNPRGDRGQD